MKTTESLVNIYKRRIDFMIATLTLLRYAVDTLDDDGLIRNRITLRDMIDNALEATNDELLEIIDR